MEEQHMADKQGVFQRLFGKKEAKPSDVPKPEVVRDYGVLPEMAAILTNGNGQAVSDMRLLAESVSGFVQTHKEWCAEMDYADFGANDAERQEETLLVFAYWLAGYSATDDISLDPLRDCRGA
jgi:hypothetical protein